MKLNLIKMNYKGKTWVIGDIHGAYKALIQVLERSGFDKENDLLITLGDICDGWSEVYECVEELLTIKNRIDVLGNHDQWFHSFLIYNSHSVSWQQGGLGTLQSYCKNLDKEYWESGNGYKTNLLDSDIPFSHKEFFQKQIKYYKDTNNRLFVHGGFNRHYLLTDQREEDIFWWDRDLWLSALSCKGTKFPLKIKESLSEIFIGHTTTMNWKNTNIPMIADIVTNIDTGAGFKGKLTIMNIDTKEYFQSDEINELYMNEKGRN